MAELDHGPDCTCGCNDEDLERITLEFDDGESVSCIVIDVFEVDGKFYAALLSEEDFVKPDEEEVEYYFYEYREAEDAYDLYDIEDDDEFEKVCEAFSEILNEEE